MSSPLPAGLASFASGLLLSAKLKRTLPYPARWPVIVAPIVSYQPSDTPGPGLAALIALRSSMPPQTEVPECNLKVRWLAADTTQAGSRLQVPMTSLPCCLDNSCVLRLARAAI